MKALALLFLLLLPALAADGLHCVVCGKGIRQGYQIAGEVYCTDHYRQALPQCANCGREIHGDYRVVSIEASPMCLICVKSFPPCFLCATPADPSKGGGKLADGRPICGADRATAVGTSEQAGALFLQASAEVVAALGPRLGLKVPVKEVGLADIPALIAASKGQYQRSSLMSGRVLGLTTLVLKSKGERRWTEPATVHLLSGVPAERMLTVCAHEYAHVWHAENHPNYVKTSAEMREGFAEWVAYKVTQRTQRPRQTAMLDYPAAGPYYEGLRKYLALERQNGVEAVLRHALTATKL